MDVCSDNYKLDSESICESSKETLGCAFGNPGLLCVNDLGHQFTESLNIEDGEGSRDKNNTNTLEEDGGKGIHANDTGITGSEKCLIKSATFPSSDVTTEALAHNADDKSTELPYSRSVSLPTPSKLVSAVKGSREKQGKPPRKLSVTWAPDVYDPIPTAVSHVPNKGHRHRSDSKRNGKNKYKSNGKSSRASKGKEKKQGRSKHGGSAKRSLYSLEDNYITTCSSFHPLEENIKACSSGLQAAGVGFDVGSIPNPFCGSSFLKKSVAKLHFPVAEAT